MISFFNRANPFYGVCPFHLYGICNEQESDSACVYGKVSGIYTFPFTIENHIGKVL